MSNVGQHRTLSNATTAQANGDEPSRVVLQPMQQMLEVIAVS
jgi:hypothetical protein